MAKKTASKANGKEKAFIPCALMRLPEEEQEAAANEAVEINPTNKPSLVNIGIALAKLFGLVSDRTPDLEDMGLTKAAITALTTKYWGAGGVKLGVAFLDGGASDLKARIISHMNAWGERANVVFQEAGGGSAQVRITRGRGGYSSYLGTDILRIPRGQATMNLEGFSMNTSEAEYRRVVRHEAGHTLGFPHEHMRRELVARLDERKVIAYFGRTQGWSPEQVRQQILTPLRDESLLSPTPSDQTSIMCYQLGGNLTTDGNPIPGGNDINDVDHNYAARIYPKVGSPPPPPPGGVLEITVHKSLAAGRYRLTSAEG